MPPSDQPQHDIRRWAMGIVKLVAVAVVLYAVSGTLSEAWRGFKASPLRPDLGWALLSAVMYLLGLTPLAYYWRQILAAWRQPSGAQLVLTSYFLGHLGKYVPGKAMVVLLRTGALRAAGGQTAPIAASVLVETLTFMAVGGVLAGLLLMIPELRHDQSPWLVGLAFGLAAVSVLPIFPPIMNRLTALYERRRGGGEATSHSLTWRLFTYGWAAAALAWAGLGLSIWMSTRAFDSAFALSPKNLLACVLAVTLPVVAGFLSLIPAGLLIRDGLMATLLAPAAGPEVAVAVAVLVRVSWVASDVVVCVILKGIQWAIRRTPP